MKRKRKKMTPEEREAYEARKAESEKNVAEAKEIFARREQRLREWDEYVARRQARLRRLTFGLLGR
jgi:ribosomal protein L9